MKHLLLHAAPVNDPSTPIQCIYCLEHCSDESFLEKHLLLIHPLETKNTVTNTFNCLICEVSLTNVNLTIYFLKKIPFSDTSQYFNSALNPFTKNSFPR